MSKLLSDEEQALRVAAYLSFYVEARDAESVEEMSKWLYKIIDMVRKSYDDGFKKASKGAFESQQAAKRAALEARLDENNMYIRELTRHYFPSSPSEPHIPLVQFHERIAELKAKQEEV